jgi:hypothetical protein
MTFFEGRGEQVHYVSLRETIFEEESQSVFFSNSSISHVSRACNNGCSSTTKCGSVKVLNDPTHLQTLA